MRARGAPTLALIALCAIALVLLVVLGLKLASSGGEQAAPQSAVELVEGVPVGVRRTPTGALAAADDYLALAAQTLEQDPAAFTALVARVYTPSVRAPTLEQAQHLREADPANVANYAQGGRGLALVAARRLDSYTPAEATVTSWLAGLVWGPHLPPRQSWDLVDTTLEWSSGRWLVASSRVDPVPAPVPAIVYVRGANDRAAAFARLSGMSTPFYGAGE